MIQQIRQHWDQGSLLKQIDVIGRTGRNWPIRDGKDQIKLITSSAKTNKEANDTQDEPATRSRNNTNVTRDPHASLSLFAPREDTYQGSLPAVMTHRTSAKPPPRDYNDLFVGNESSNRPAAKTQHRERSASPSKGGAGKNYGPARIFDNDEDEQPTPEKLHSADKFYKPNPSRYQHFELGNGEDAPVRPANAVKSKHASQWAFEDFQTPQKVVPTRLTRTQDVRHWGNEEDDTSGTPIHFKKADKPRKDAETHFEFIDDGIPDESRRAVYRPRGAGQNNGMGLYRNNVYDEEQKAAEPGLERKVINNPISIKDRHKDFDPHFSMTDDSPSSKPSQGPQVEPGVERKVANNPISIKDRHKDFDPHFSMTDDSPSSKQARGPLPEDRAKAVKMMDANWKSYDQSPNQKENVQATQAASNHPSGKGPLSESTNLGTNRSEYKGIAVGGDGMGGKIGSGRSWGFGDESGGEQSPQAHKAVPGKKQTQRSTGGDFWDF